MSTDLTIYEKIKDIILNVDQASIVKDAKSVGMEVTEMGDFINHAQNYAYIEKLADRYGKSTAALCAVSGATSGIGGITTTVAFMGLDVANMAAQLYRYNQKLAILNGFDPENELHQDKALTIFLSALGVDATAQAGLRALLTKAASENLAKKGPASAPVIRIIMEVSKILGVRITKAQAGKLIPFVGAAVGGGVNYVFSRAMIKKMQADYKSAYFDRWQLHSKDAITD